MSNKSKTFDELVNEALKDAPTLEGYSIKELAELVDRRQPRELGYGGEIVTHFRADTHKKEVLNDA